MVQDQATQSSPDLGQGIALAELADGGKLVGHVAGEEVLLVRRGASGGRLPDRHPSRRRRRPSPPTVRPGARRSGARREADGGVVGLDLEPH